MKRFNEEIANNCQIYKCYKRSSPRPVASLPLARKSNDVVAMDLKVVKNGELYIIHFIDLFTRFSKAHCLKGKLPQVVLTWINDGFGVPNKVLVDNGGEFDNLEDLNTMEQYNIEVCATWAEWSWSNGVCERNHAVIDLMLEKMMLEDEALKTNEALAHAVSAKNSMQN